MPSSPSCRAKRLVKVPDAVTLDSAAAIMLQGMTAHYLTHSTYALRAGETALVHAAAGGAGSMVVQIARLLGATVFGTVGSAAKAEIARAAGAHETIDYTRQDFEAEVKRLTNGRGVDVVYDSVGKDTFDEELELPAAARDARAVRILERAGRAVRSRGARREGLAVPHAAGAQSVHRDARGVAAALEGLFRWVASGEVTPRIERVWPLAEAARRTRARGAAQHR